MTSTSTTLSSRTYAPRDADPNTLLTFTEFSRQVRSFGFSASRNVIRPYSNRGYNIRVLEVYSPNGTSTTFPSLTDLANLSPSTEVRIGYGHSVPSTGYQTQSTVTLGGLRFQILPTTNSNGFYAPSNGVRSPTGSSSTGSSTGTSSGSTTGTRSSTTETFSVQLDFTIESTDYATALATVTRSLNQLSANVNFVGVGTTDADSDE